MLYGSDDQLLWEVNLMPWPVTSHSSGDSDVTNTLFFAV